MIETHLCSYLETIWMSGRLIGSGCGLVKMAGIRSQVPFSLLILFLDWICNKNRGKVMLSMSD